MQTVYADDVVRTSATRSPEHIPTHVDYVNTAMATCLDPIHVQQNFAKQVHVVSCSGRGASGHLASIYANQDIPGKLETFTRYLG